MPEGQDAAEPYRLVLARGAPPALTDRLPTAAAFAAWEFISGPLLQRPHVVGVALRAPFQRLWRARRGEYRVRYRIDEPSHTVYIVDIDHRRDAYRG